MPITPKDVLTDPKFQSLSPDQRRQVLLRIDPRFRDLNVDQQQAVLGFKAPLVSTLPTGEISSGPHGTAALKSSGYSAGYKAADMARRNADLIGGTVGGVAGTAAGGPAGGVGGAALGGAAGEALRQIWDTVRGNPKGSSMEAAEDIGLSGLEQGGMELAGAGIGRLGKAIKPVSRVDRLAYGARIGELSPELSRVLPDIDKAAGRSVPKGAGALADFDKLLNTTERQLNQEFNAALFPIARQPIMPQPVAQAIRGQITPNMLKTPEGRASAAYLRNRALQFENQTWTIGELNAERELITKRLRAWHDAVSSGQAAQSKVQAHIAADTAAENALKDMIYDAADHSGVKPQGYFRDLKQRQSNLISLMDATKVSRSRVTKESAEKAGAPLSQKIHLRGYLHPTTGTPGGVAGVNPSMLGDAQASADKAVSRGFPSSTSKAVNAARKGVGTAISQPDVNALPLRLLFGDFSDPQEEAQP